MNVNARERLLILILAVLVILLGGFKLLIEPEVKRLSLVNDEYGRIREEKQNIRNNELLTEAMVAENRSLEDMIHDESGVFFPELESDSIHIFFQDLFNNSGIRAESFTMTDKAAKQITNPVPVSAGITYPAKAAAEGIVKSGGSGAGINAAAATAAAQGLNPVQGAVQSGGSGTAAQAAVRQTAADLMEMVAVTVQFNGSYADCLRLLDGIKNSGRTVRVTSLNVSSTRTGQLGVSVTAECFGVMKFTGEDPLSKDSLPSPAGRYDPFRP